MKKIKKYRRLTQITVLFFLILMPILNIFEIHFMKGTLYSLDIGSVSISDPLAVMQAIIASKSINIHMIISIIIPIIMVIFFGRVFCSFMCPYYFATEILENIKSKLNLKTKKTTYNKLNATKTNIKRYSILIFGLLLTGIAGIPILNFFSAPGIISSQILVFLKFHTLTIEFLLIIILLILELFYFKFWCRIICPVGTFLSLFTFKKTMHISHINKNCSNCKKCIKVCPMALNPMEEGSNSLCFNCGDCIDICPDNRKKETLNFRIGD